MVYCVYSKEANKNQKTEGKLIKMLIYNITQVDAGNSAVVEWTEDIAGGQIIEPNDVIEAYRSEAEDIIVDACENDGQDYTEDEINEKIDAEWEEVAELITEDLREAIADELEMMYDNVQSAMSNFGR